MSKIIHKATAAEKAEINRLLATRESVIYVMKEFGYNNVVRAQDEYYREKKKNQKQTRRSYNN